METCLGDRNHPIILSIEDTLENANKLFADYTIVFGNIKIAECNFIYTWKNITVYASISNNMHRVYNRQCDIYIRKDCGDNDVPFSYELRKKSKDIRSSDIIAATSNYIKDPVILRKVDIRYLYGSVKFAEVDNVRTAVSKILRELCKSTKPKPQFCYKIDGVLRDGEHIENAKKAFENYRGRSGEKKFAKVTIGIKCANRGIYRFYLYSHTRIKIDGLEEIVWQRIDRPRERVPLPPGQQVLNN